MLRPHVDLVFCRYYSTLDKKQIVFLTNPIETSLARLKSKLLYNVVVVSPSKKRLFITLTVDENHYDEVFKEYGASTFIRKYLNRLRMAHKRSESEFEYAWRLERGSQNTQRLHFHMIIESGWSRLEIMRYITSTWDVCRWDQLNVERSFEELNESNRAALYVSTYCSAAEFKNSDGELIESPAQTLQWVKHGEKSGRIWSTSRGFKQKPPHLRMQFNWDVKIWEPKMKRNWRMGPTGPENYAPYLKLRILSYKRAYNKEHVRAWLDDIANSDISELGDWRELEGGMDAIIEQYNQICSKFCYMAEFEPSPAVQLVLDHSPPPSARIFLNPELAF